MRIKNFGTFEVTGRPGRVGVNPMSGEKIFIPPHKGLTFRPARRLRDVALRTGPADRSRDWPVTEARVQKRLYYKIGEACKALDIQPYVLRYWETEFPVLAPNKSQSGQRVYSEKELGIIRRIKELLYDEGYTIAGAKKKLETEMAAGGPAAKAASSPKRRPRRRARAAVRGTSAGAGAPP